MRNIKILYSIICLALYSCQGMNLAPEDKYSDSQFWRTANDFRLAANEFYGYLESFHGDDNFANYDLKADLSTSYFGFNSVSNGRWLPSENDLIWDNGYSHLRHINILIEHLDALNTDDTEILRYKGEALFFRAYEHFRLLNNLLKYYKIWIHIYTFTLKYKYLLLNLLLNIYY